MKNFIIYLFVLLISNIYAECDDYGQSQCSNDNNCEWVDNIETEYCDGENAAECLTQDECSWDLTYGGYLSFEWYYSCNGYYEIDNSYCQEIVMPECSEMGMLQCNINDSCNWIDDIESVTCASLVWDEELCEAAPECTYSCWDAGGYFGWCTPECTGGMTYVDNSYCQEIEISECSSLLTESNCNHLDECEWVDNIEMENCYDILDCSGGCAWQDCEALEGCNWLWDSYPSYCYGEHEVDNSYCEEIEYLLGDINQDSIINIQDIIIIINLILNGQFDLVADINLDSTINILDVVQIVNIILN